MRVESTAIRVIVYNALRLRLRVTFTSGVRYEYRDVPGDLHRAFLQAESKGRFFQAQIRDRYPYERLS